MKYRREKKKSKKRTRWQLCGVARYNKLFEMWAVILKNLSVVVKTSCSGIKEEVHKPKCAWLLWHHLLEKFVDKLFKENILWRFCRSQGIHCVSVYLLWNKQTKVEKLWCLAGVWLYYFFFYFIVCRLLSIL